MKRPALYMYGQSGDNLLENEGHLPHMSLTPDCLSINLYMYISNVFSMRQEGICNQFLDRLNKKNFTPEKL
jgi:hypothetical protein